MNIKILLSNNDLKSQLKKSLIFLFHKKSDEIFHLINNIKTNEYLIINDNNEFEIQHTNITDYSRLYLTDISFIKMIDILKKCNKDTYVIKINDKTENNNLMKSCPQINYFFPFSDVFCFDEYLIYTNNEIHVITTYVYEELFNKYKPIDINTFLRSIKLKQIVK